jgi:hypothetical protein
MFPDAHTAPMQLPIRVTGIVADSHQSDMYSVVKIHFPGVDSEGEAVSVELEMEVHLIRGLRCNMLIGTDMMTPYGVSLNFGMATFNIRAYGVVAPI